jgi:tetratricopeptide (TPR) repeat protein
MTLKDASGHAVSGANAASLDMLETALHEFRCYVDDPVATVQRALAASPEMPMAHVMHAYLYLLGTEPEGRAVARESHRAAQALPADARERAHIEAVGLMVDGRWRAASRVLEDLSIEHPRDALALQAGHLADFFLGDSRMLHDRIARALPHWSASMPGYHAVLSMQAFGLEENGRYERAEKMGRQAVELQPRDGWGQHAVAHVMEMQNRRREGLAWMRANPAAWSEGSFFAVHNWWHTALFHLGLGEVDEVLALFDGPIAGGQSALVLDLIDASALLWRLQLLGVDVGSRWEPVADRWAPMARAGNYAFNDMHAMMAFAMAGRSADAQAVLEAQAAAAEADDDNADFTLEVGAAATRAVKAYADGDFAAAVELLRPIRNKAHRFGGSHAQRDLLDQTLIDAARRDGQSALAQALLAERQSAQAQAA